MEFKVIGEPQHQTFGSDSGASHVVVFNVEYTQGDYKNNAYLEFPEDTSSEDIQKEIIRQGKELIPKSNKVYDFSKSGTIE